MRIAVLADIHGNNLALAAVLADLRDAQPDIVLQLGDALNGPFDPCAVLRLIGEISAINILGNCDRMVLDQGDPKVSRSTLFARACLSASDLAFVSTWAPLHSQDDWSAFHGSPGSDSEYLLERVSPSSVSLKSTREIIDTVGLPGESLLLCAHSHIPRVVHLPDRRLIVNPGSVGLPAYKHDDPFPHKMETGSPHARYAIIDRINHRWHVSLKAIPYDWESAARAAEADGWSNWARTLRSGYA